MLFVFKQRELNVSLDKSTVKCQWKKKQKNIMVIDKEPMILSYFHIFRLYWFNGYLFTYTIIKVSLNALLNKSTIQNRNVYCQIKVTLMSTFQISFPVLKWDFHFLQATD